MDIKAIKELEENLRFAERKGMWALIKTEHLRELLRLAKADWARPKGDAE